MVVEIQSTIYIVASKRSGPGDYHVSVYDETIQENDISGNFIKRAKQAAQ